MHPKDFEISVTFILMFCLDITAGWVNCKSTEDSSIEIACFGYCCGSNNVECCEKDGKTESRDEFASGSINITYYMIGGIVFIIVLVACALATNKCLYGEFWPCFHYGNRYEPSSRVTRFSYREESQGNITGAQQPTYSPSTHTGYPEYPNPNVPIYQQWFPNRKHVPNTQVSRTPQDHSNSDHAPKSQRLPHQDAFTPITAQQPSVSKTVPPTPQQRDIPLSSIQQPSYKAEEISQQLPQQDFQPTKDSDMNQSSGPQPSSSQPWNSRKRWTPKPDQPSYRRPGVSYPKDSPQKDETKDND